METFAQLIELVLPLVTKGWHGLITVYVAWHVLKQFRTWQVEKDARAEAKRLGLKHNPSIEVHDAIEAALTPLRADIANVRNDVADVRDRISRVEGLLERSEL